MRQRPAHRWALAAAGPLAALLLAGCGIRETDVIEAGGPATVGYIANPDIDSLLFFRLPHGDVVPVVRTLGSYEGVGHEPRRPTPEKVMAALLSGPLAEEKAAGLSSALPPVTAGGARLLEPLEAPVPGEVTMQLPLAVRPLDATAVRQLICTVAFLQDPGGGSPVRLRGTDGGTKSGTCDMDLRTDGT
ncbi:hypothetical protein OG897_22645 [Streptomyces sp. NBC_00237]|uniref:hypothetical protein n=1 Tax=Streptomyces sp. NBC_00237 TaxID=2975687 RepID=UPI00225177F9|nr:hypothetical protein [Streptomyces sp. NBC_00237]MCX5204237.1 hypothetical protein [Streptomyces sp. NBC_00237]